jgi:hypothetical protein
LPRSGWRTCSRTRATRRLYTPFFPDLVNVTPVPRVGTKVVANQLHCEITVAIARDTQAAQDAVDRELISYYRPGQKRGGLLVQLVERVHHLQDLATRSRHDWPVQLSAVPERVTFPFDIWRLVDVRWQELWLSPVLCLRDGGHSLRSARRRTAFLHDRRPEIEAATEAHAQDACGLSQRKPSQDSAGGSNPCIAHHHKPSIYDALARSASDLEGSARDPSVFHLLISRRRTHRGHTSRGTLEVRPRRCLAKL